MTAQFRQALKVSLAAWLAVSVLAAGALIHLPHLHAELHCEATSSCCDAGCESADEHCPDSETELPADHQCLIELLAAGCVDVPITTGFVPVSFVPISETALLDAGQLASSISSSALPGRAPPIC